MEEENKKIIEDIFSGLTKDAETDLDLLQIKKEVYKNHPRYNNILDKILIKEKEYLTDQNKEAFETMMNTYKESVDYGIGLAKEYFDKGDKESTKKILETLIKSFSNSYINDEFGNCVYFDTEFEKALYLLVNKDDRPVFNCVVNKGYVYYMYGRILLEDNKVKEAMLSFDLAKTYTPFLKEAYFFKALLLKVNQRFKEAKEELLLAHKYIYKNIDLADFYYFVGNYCYKFINKEYEYLMYQKSYSLHPNNELYEELISLKPVDKDLDLDEKYFEQVCEKEEIPLGYDLDLDYAKKKLFDDNEKYKNEYENV